MSKPAVNKSKTAKAKSTDSVKPSLWRRLNPFRWLFRNWFKLALIFAIVLGSYCVYLDAQISKKFAGNKWQVPAQIFARPMFLSSSI